MRQRDKDRFYITSNKGSVSGTEDLTVSEMDLRPVHTLPLSSRKTSGSKAEDKPVPKSLEHEQNLDPQDPPQRQSQFWTRRILLRDRLSSGPAGSSSETDSVLDPQDPPQRQTQFWTRLSTLFHFHLDTIKTV
uniref:Uncharacterized protein n=1 Tax=Knipowitschia caucasica TaxID=637954 RepID=A0AAV2L7X4_KNICA